MNSDFIDLLRLFDAHEVHYLVVGGYAVSDHAQTRFTKDQVVTPRRFAIRREETEKREGLKAFWTQAKP